MKSSRRRSGECLRGSQNIADDDESRVRYNRKLITVGDSRAPLYVCVIVNKGVSGKLARGDVVSGFCRRGLL